MTRRKTTVYLDEELLRSARALATRTGKDEHEVFEEALRAHLGLDVLQKVWSRKGLPDEEKSLELAYEELHAMRAEEDAGDGAVGGPTSPTGQR